MDKNKKVGRFCCVQGKMPLLAGILVFLAVIWALFAVADRTGLGFTSVFSRRTITVSGSANRRQANEIASFGATVSSKNVDKAEAVSEVTQKSERLVADLKDFGIADKDLETQSLNIYRDQVPYLENGVQKYKDGDWNANISVSVVLRDVSRASDLTDLLAKSEASNVWGPSYSLSEGEPEKAQLLKQAFDNAKSKADYLAGGMGFRVGKVLSVVEGSDYNSSVYSLRSAGGGMGGGEMEPGSSNVSATLTVTFELR